jgi:hypothetical protein
MNDASTIAASLIASERRALQTLPVLDRGHLPDELWWAYVVLLDDGLAVSNGNYLISITPLGRRVLQALNEQGLA